MGGSPCRATVWTSIRARTLTQVAASGSPTDRGARHFSNSFLAFISSFRYIRDNPSWSTMKRLLGKMRIAFLYISSLSSSDSFSSFLFVLNCCNARVSRCNAFRSSVSISSITAELLLEVTWRRSAAILDSMVNGWQSMKNSSLTFSLVLTASHNAVKCLITCGMELIEARVLLDWDGFAVLLRTLQGLSPSRNSKSFWPVTGMEVMSVALSLALAQKEAPMQNKAKSNTLSISRNTPPSR